MTKDDEIFDQAQKLYESGDFTSAFPLYIDLARRGRVGCQRFVGWMYFLGEGTAQDLDEAYKWFRKAADNGDREAKFGAGRVCLLLKRDVEAKDWFLRACREDFPPGCFRLGWMYKHGRGGEANVAMAFDLFEQAYEKGHLPAGRARASFLIGGHFGFARRFEGLYCMAKVLVEIVVAAIRNPKSQKFMV
jgi:uncharacterized protein